MKPIILAVEETKTQLLNVVNDAVKENVPCYFLEPILMDILIQVKNTAQIELEKARAMQEEPKDENSGD